MSKPWVLSSALHPLTMVANASNPNVCEEEGRESGIQGHFWCHRKVTLGNERLPQKSKPGETDRGRGISMSSTLARANYIVNPSQKQQSHINKTYIQSLFVYSWAPQHALRCAQYNNPVKWKAFWIECRDFRLLFQFLRSCSYVSPVTFFPFIKRLPSRAPLLRSGTWEVQVLLAETGQRWIATTGHCCLCRLNA